MATLANSKNIENTTTTVTPMPITMTIKNHERIEHLPIFSSPIMPILVLLLVISCILLTSFWLYPSRAINQKNQIAKQRDYVKVRVCQSALDELVEKEKMFGVRADTYEQTEKEQAFHYNLNCQNLRNEAILKFQKTHPNDHHGDHTSKCVIESLKNEDDNIFIHSSNTPKFNKKARGSIRNLPLSKGQTPFENDKNLPFSKHHRLMGHFRRINAYEYLHN